MAVSHTEKFITAESITWTAPTGVTDVATEVRGGGGGGSGNHTTSGSPGGGGGAYSKDNSYTVTPGNTYTVFVGAGAAGSGGENTVDGEDSYFVNTSTVLAKGGASGGNGYQGGAAGSGVGDTKYSGGNSYDPLATQSQDFGGGGGGGAGDAANGGNASTSNNTAGTGGSSGGGNGGNGGSDSATHGSPGNAPGGGGGGAGADTPGGTDYAGAAGARGEATLTYSYNGVGLVGVGAQVTGTTSPLTATLPAGVAADDLVLIVAVNRSGGDTSETSTGYTERASQNLEIGANDMTLTLLYKVAGASEANPSVASSDATGGWSVQAIVYRNIDTTDPFAVDAAVTGTNAAAATLTPTGVTTDTNLALAISIVSSADDNALTISTSQAFSGRMYEGDYDTITGVDHAVGFGDKPIPTAGAVTFPTWQQTLVGNDVWCYISDAIKPVAAPPPGGTYPGMMTGTGIIY